MSFTRAEYFEVVEPILAHVQVALYPSNTYIGASQAYGIVYELVEIQPGEVVGDLPGGHYVRRGDEWYEVNLAPSEKHLFEKTYVPPPRPEWPSDKVRPVASITFGRRFQPASKTAGWVYEHGTQIGRSIDYTIEKEAD